MGLMPPITTAGHCRLPHNLCAVAGLPDPVELDHMQCRYRAALLPASSRHGEYIWSGVAAGWRGRHLSDADYAGVMAAGLG